MLAPAAAPAEEALPQHPPAEDEGEGEGLPGEAGETPQGGFGPAAAMGMLIAALIEAGAAAAARMT